MKDRIIRFLSENNLTSTKFADIIDVQRSSISHILSGRNKPSFDFIEKMLLAYPNLNAQWVITGKGNMYTNQPSLFEQEQFHENEILSSRESNIQNLTINRSDKVNSEQEKDNISDIDLKSKSKPAEIERVVIFYSNGSFKEYKPE